MRKAIPVAMLLALGIYTSAHAGRISGRVAPNAPSGPEACDTLGGATQTLHIVHGRIMRGITFVWGDSTHALPGNTWELYYPALAPGTYQASSWSTKATNGMVGCPEVVTFTVEARYGIVFGWTTVGALRENSTGRIIGTAEVMRLLNECLGRP